MIYSVVEADFKRAQARDGIVYSVNGENITGVPGEVVLEEGALDSEHQLLPVKFLRSDFTSLPVSGAIFTESGNKWRMKGKVPGRVLITIYLLAEPR